MTHILIENVSFILKFFFLSSCPISTRCSVQMYMTLKAVKKTVRTFDNIPIQMHDKIRLLYTLIIRLKYDEHMYEHSTQVDATDKPVCNTVVLFWLLISQDNLRCFGRHSQRKKATLKSSCVALKSWNILHFIDPKLIRLHSFEFRIAIWVNIRLL